MPLIAHSALPTFERLRREGVEVLHHERAAQQDIRELHIGLLNMMPDAALEATERQFLRLVGACNRIAQVYIHPFTVPGIKREGAARVHVDTHYEDFSTLRELGLDAIIISGANPANPDITQEGFWNGMAEVMEWGRENVCSMLCSCLATHAVLKIYHGVERVRLPRKRWGVYSHRHRRAHPLLAQINTRFDAPHSHVYEVSCEQIESSGATVLVASEEQIAHLAVSADGLRFVYFQGHPEYDGSSLLKEYKREVTRFFTGERDEYAPFPEHYFSAEAAAVLESHRQAVTAAKAAKTDGAACPVFPDSVLEALVDNTWGDTGKALFNNWLGLVYQLTHLDRRIPFMDGVDPEDPLSWREDLQT